ALRRADGSWLLRASRCVGRALVCKWLKSVPGSCDGPPPRNQTDETTSTSKSAKTRKSTPRDARMSVGPFQHPVPKPVPHPALDAPFRACPKGDPKRCLEVVATVWIAGAAFSVLRSAGPTRAFRQAAP